MRASVLFFALALCLVGWSDAAGAQATSNQASPLVGTWTAEDPATGQQEQLIITANTLQFGADEPEIPYTAQGSGGFYEIFIGGPGNPPARFTFRDADNAELAIPGGPTIALVRAPEAPAATAAGPAGSDAAAPGAGEGTGESVASVMDELTAALVPYGVATRFEPLNRSLEQLLSEGWQLDQAAGASGAYTLLLRNGKSHALCMLVPKNLGQADTALSDCRRLN
ncbi:hypothetical protein [Pelagibius sp. 7325]|uniref:hypothetical protein n=1 Tax=Pelagibius sp. 7325 TaxID=3131994 RepID=UPI0030EB86FC